ncbi:dihydrodipicolinate reductase [Anaeromyxobacter sp. PSR-1]|uniref:NAD(P)H-dependent amine dehydrogenase family protein n=1 Tax=Anaeromyxobacter sp. PSR-1 TaxID=1300915 RepID=UPI0005E622CE|nr:dihydrodipicolinate reductase [Anaeromyxobacter sp. PSR-1]GAO05369.1 4-hydroxy-tetrahydrodipicolinate reductase [Anaeromyxobacter sp. PSR-1]
MDARGIPVVVMGLGEIGRAIARAALARPDLELVAAVDSDPSLAGRPLGELLGVPAPSVKIAADPKAALAAAKGGVLLLATASTLDAVRPDVERAVRAGLSVVSTCEELAYPWLRHEEDADALDRLCEQRNVAVLGTGANPGFVLDRLAAVLGHATGPVRHVRGLRVVDASRRRAALLRKIGAGLTEDAFHEAAERGEVGHVGLAESAALAATGLGLGVDEVDEELAPLVAEEDARGGPVPVLRGQVAGFTQVARVFADEREVVRLELTIAVDADDPRDEVELDADPPLRLVVPGGVPGDAATAAAVVNAAAAVTELRGLVTVLDLPAGR